MGKDVYYIISFSPFQYNMYNILVNNVIPFLAYLVVLNVAYHDIIESQLQTTLNYIIAIVK